MGVVRGSSVSAIWARMGTLTFFFRGENTWFLIEQKDLVPAIPVAIPNIIIIFECV